jgi:integrase
METVDAVDGLFRGIEQHYVRNTLKRACRSAKVRGRTPRDLRRTYATILLMDHYSPGYVQKQLGRHLITLTVDTYGHWIRGGDDFLSSHAFP